MSNKFVLGLWGVFALASAASGAMFYTETFDVAPAGWADRDAGEMAVSHTGGFGNPAGSMEGAFALQGVPSPEVDAFRITQSEFVGDYWSSVVGFTSWAFDFYADDVLPSEVTVRFSNGVNTFFRSATAQVGAIDSWASVNLSLSYAGWVGGTATAFSNALANVQWIDIQVSRSGSGAQEYFVDNFQLLGSSGGSSAVPEPGTGLLLLSSLGLLTLMRRQLKMAERTEDRFNRLEETL